MIRNNLVVDVRVKCIENGITQAHVRMMEELEYDMEIVYVKR